MANYKLRMTNDEWQKMLFFLFFILWFEYFASFFKYFLHQPFEGIEIYWISESYPLGIPYTIEHILLPFVFTVEYFGCEATIGVEAELYFYIPRYQSVIWVETVKPKRSLLISEEPSLIPASYDTPKLSLLSSSDNNWLNKPAAVSKRL